MIISGYEVLIDKEDEERLMKYNYRLVKSMLKKDGKYYFSRKIRINKRQKTTSLHRDILQCVFGDGKIVDHINGNTLDNRKSNLRICTHTENMRNSVMRKNNKAGIKGVSWHKAVQKWRAQIKVNNVIMHLGYFIDKNKAGVAYNEASKKYHGNYGRTY